MVLSRMDTRGASPMTAGTSIPRHTTSAPSALHGAWRLLQRWRRAHVDMNTMMIYGSSAACLASVPRLYIPRSLWLQWIAPARPEWVAVLVLAQSARGRLFLASVRRWMGGGASDGNGALRLHGGRKSSLLCIYNLSWPRERRGCAWCCAVGRES